MNARLNTRTGVVLGGRYKLLTPIAQGGMGEVWKARDAETGRLVAAKVLKTELFGEELPLSRLRIEAKNSMSIQHPNIANVQDSGEEDGRGWIVMELIEGRPLTHYVKNGARIASEDLIPILTQVAMALGAAANAGIVHRDIKPANILVRPDGIVKLTDFGISRSAGQADLTAAGMVMGTAQYLPPEQAMGETATSLGDLYALGVIAYEALAGRRPFTGATQVDIAFSHVNDPVPPLPADVPAPIAEVVLHLLEKSPAKRPESGLALVRELTAAAQEMGIRMKVHPLPEPPGDEGEAPAPEGPSTTQAPVHHIPRRTLPEEMLATPEALTRPGTVPPPATLTAVPSASTIAEFSSSTPLSSLTSAATTPAASAPSPTPASSPVFSPATASAAPPSDTPSRTVPRVAERDKESSQQRRIALAERLKKRSEERVATAPVIRTKTATASPRPSWLSITPANATHTTHAKTHAALSQAPEALVPAATKYNRSRVAPPPTGAQRARKALLILAVLIGVTALTVFAIQHILASLTSILGEGGHVLEEVHTWQSPRAVV